MGEESFPEYSLWPDQQKLFHVERVLKLSLNWVFRKETTQVRVAPVSVSPPTCTFKGLTAGSEFIRSSEKCMHNFWLLDLTIISEVPHKSVEPPLIFSYFYFEGYRLSYSLSKWSWATVPQAFWRPFKVFLWTLAAFSLVFSVVLVPDHFQRNFFFVRDNARRGVHYQKLMDDAEA